MQRLNFKRRRRIRKVVYFSTFMAIMKRMRKQSRRWSHINFEEQIKWIYLAMAGATHRDYDDGIDKEQFLQIVSYIELEITKDVAKENRIAVIKKTVELQTRQVLEKEELDRSASSIRSLSSSPTAVMVGGFTRYIRMIPILWYKMRFKLIAFWEWRRRIVCCQT